MNLAAILASLIKISQVASIAQSFVGMFAAAHTAADPTATNQALTTAAKVATATQTAAQDLYAIGEQTAAAQVSNGGTPLTGAQKLATVYAIAQEAHTAAMSVATGGALVTFNDVWGGVNTAITAIAATNKPVKLEQMTAGG